MRRDAAAQEALELARDEARQPTGALRPCEEGRQMLLHHLVNDRPLAAAVAWSR